VRSILGFLGEDIKASLVVPALVARAGVMHEMMKSGDLVVSEKNLQVLVAQTHRSIHFEDDIVVTESGCEVLTKSPKELLVVG
ncbi:MAG: hypothetical protein K8R88_07270, partial [Armatimonadetes bacterium]|nr:hypothetical protein [Armatimonadota bacterium]